MCICSSFGVFFSSAAIWKFFKICKLSVKVEINTKYMILFSCQISPKTPSSFIQPEEINPLFSRHPITFSFEIDYDYFWHFDTKIAFFFFLHSPLILLISDDSHLNLLEFLNSRNLWKNSKRHLLTSETITMKKILRNRCRQLSVQRIPSDFCCCFGRWLFSDGVNNLI